MNALHKNYNNYHIKNFFEKLFHTIDNDYNQTLWNWMKENPTYTKDKVFQAWVWINSNELDVTWNTTCGRVPDYYQTLFNRTIPTKKAIMEVVDIAMKNLSIL